MSYPFSEIIIIYNPNSTGDGETNAKSLNSELEVALPKVTISLKQTTHAGHAEEIGAKYAEKDSRTLLISASGEGGYNELVNGVLSQRTKHVAVCVLPSGNANDHHYATRGRKSLSERIIAGKTRKLDVIKVSAKKDGKNWQRYAHSYVGIGMTAYIGKKLTEAKLNPINEKWLVLKYLLKFRSVTLKLEGTHRWRHYSSVVIGNIDRMSKIISLDKSASTYDGKIELYTMRSRSFLKLLFALMSASVIGMKPDETKSEFSLMLKRETAIQLDGEVFQLDAGRLRSIISEKVRSI